MKFNTFLRKGGKKSPPKGHSHKAKRRRRWVIILLEVFAVFFGLGLLAVSGLLIWISTLPIPDVSNFDERKITESTKIFDREGEVLLFDVHENIKRTVIDTDDISIHMRNAIVAIEDQNFYKHKGVEPRAILRAAISNLRDGDLLGGQGGSTITQQVIKNALLSNEKTLTRKFKEWILALRLERVIEKEEILTIYLNESPFGGQIYGVEEAARGFFDKPASELTVLESAYLASLPQAPTYLSPYGNNVEMLEERKDKVLRNMLDNGFISEEEYAEAQKETVDFNRPEERGIRAPHFVMYVRGLLEEKYGKDVVQEGGLRVITTLNYDLQREGEDIVRKYALENAVKFNASNAALVALDPQTGQILTMVGSRDYFDEDIGGNFNIALAERQPGSTFKPFVYATAFMRGYTPETIIYDTRTQFNVNCDTFKLESSDGCFSPENYDFAYAGPVTMRNALAQSKNVPAVKTLYLAGINNSIDTARKMGLSSLDSNGSRYGLSLVLGAGEVRLLDLANAYGTFANDGVFNETTPILRIEDRRGNIIEEFEKKDERVIDRNIARTITDVLSDNNARTPAFGSNSPLYFPGRDVAAKTGTTNDYRDVWTVGYTPDIVVAAWAGNNDNSSMEKKVAGFIITPLWNEFMQEALKEVPDNEFSAPEIDYDGLKPILRGSWQEQGAMHNILYYVNKNDPRNPSIPANPAVDGQYLHWEAGVQAWLGGRGLGEFGVDVIETIEENTIDGEAYDLRVIGLKDAYEKNERVKLSVAPRGFEIERVRAYLNNDRFASVRGPFRFSFTPEDFEGLEASNILLLRIDTVDGTVIEKTYTVDISDF